MTEREKMLKGDFYNTRDKELLNIHKKARNIMDKFNNTREENKIVILKDLLGNIEEGVWIESPFYCDYGENITIGRNSFINFNCTFLDSNKIEIGKNVLIGPNTQIYTVTHPVKVERRVVNNPRNEEAPYETYSKKVKIGDNVWIGGNVCILPGVTIGDNVVIGAGSVVTKSIPSNYIAAGNPCRIIRETGD